MARLGADPEVFLQDKGKHIAACGLIGADKWNPLQLDGLPQGFTIQEDNVTMEFGIPPASTAEEFFQHIDTVMAESLRYVYTGLAFSKLSCTVFEKDQMVHPMAHVFGCEPDWCAWTEKENAKPKPPHEFMRSCGGHVHVETDQDAIEGVKKFDLYMSIPLVLMDDGHQRKQLYGKAGAFRKKPYGFEYRTPSNWWIAPGEDKETRKKRCEWVWRQAQRALQSNINVKELEEVVPKCINENDTGLAQALINHYELEVL
jgi:hypothetical protein